MLGLGNTIIGGAVLEEETPWAVTDLGDLAHWYKYNTGITLGTGDEVATWADNHGSNNLSIGAGKVFKNSGDLDFITGSSGGRLTLGTTWNPGTFSAYLVLRVTAATVSNEEIMNAGNNDFIRFNNSTTARVRIGDSTSNNISLPGDAIAQNTWFVFGVEWDGSTIRVYQDTDYATPTTASDSDTFAGVDDIGKRGNAFDGQIREVVFINDVLSSSDRENLMTHLETIRDV